MNKILLNIGTKQDIRIVRTVICLVLTLFFTLGSSQGSMLSSLIDRNTRSLPFHARPAKKKPVPTNKAQPEVVENTWDLTPAVLNVSHYDTDTDTYFKDALAGKLKDIPDSNEPVRLELVIHKATDGMTQDSQYAERQKLATKSGYLWGAYHYAPPTGDPVAQADNFLQTVKQNVPDRSKPCRALLVLDLEYFLKTKRHLGLANAALFVKRINEVTRTYPGLYIGQDYLKEQVTKLKPSSEEFKIFQECWLWVPRYYERFPEIPPAAPWKTWTMWQFTADAIPARATVLPDNGGIMLKTPELSLFRGNRAYLRKWYAEHAWIYYDPTQAKKGKRS